MLPFYICDLNHWGESKGIRGNIDFLIGTGAQPFPNAKSTKICNIETKMDMSGFGTKQAQAMFEAVVVVSSAIASQDVGIRIQNTSIAC